MAKSKAQGVDSIALCCHSAQDRHTSKDPTLAHTHTHHGARQPGFLRKHSNNDTRAADVEPATIMIQELPAVSPLHWLVDLSSLSQPPHAICPFFSLILPPQPHLPSPTSTAPSPFPTTILHLYSLISPSSPPQPYLSSPTFPYQR